MWTLRRFFMLGFVLATLLPLAAGGVAVWQWLMPSLRNQAIEANALLAHSLVGQVRHYLNLPQGLMEAAAQSLQGANPSMHSDEVLTFMTRADGVFSTAYITDERRRIAHISMQRALGSSAREWLGTELSALPAPSERSTLSNVYWSGSFFSRVSKEQTSLAVLPVGKRMLAAEISLTRLATFIQQAVPHFGGQIVIADQSGIFLAHLNRDHANGFARTDNNVLLRTALQQGQASGVFERGNVRYIGAATRIDPQGWVVLVAQPLDAALRPGWHVMLMVCAVGLAMLALALLIAYYMARYLAHHTEALADTATLAAEAHQELDWPQIEITEYAQLVNSIRSLLQVVRRREQELRAANYSLEDKVMERTQALTEANDELSTTIENMLHMRDTLDRAERLASLGRLVAGVAHELNTPIGNSLIVATTLQTRLHDFRAETEHGLRRSVLSGFEKACEEAAAMLAHNLEHASELIHSFKQVAVDQSTAQRRSFDLAEKVAEIVCMYEPTLRRRAIEIETSVPAGISMQSFPGPLGQVLGNFIENAMVHGYDGMSGGRIRISGEILGKEVLLRVADWGHGIAPEVLPRIFDPFFTTRFGRGGTGLGLHLSHQIVTDILGGSVQVSSAPGEPTCFSILVPCQTPALPEAGQSGYAAPANPAKAARSWAAQTGSPEPLHSPCASG